MPNEDEVKFGAWEALAAALSGLTGGDFAGDFARRIERERERKKQEERQAVEDERYNRQEARLSMRDIQDIYEGLGLNEASRKRISEPIQMEGVTSEQSVMTGIPEVDAILSTLPEQYRTEAAIGGRGRGIRAIQRRENEAEADFQRRLAQIPEEERVRSAARVETAGTEFDALADVRRRQANEDFQEWMKRHNIEVRDRPPSESPYETRRFYQEQLQGVAFDEAEQLTLDPRMNRPRAMEFLKDTLREHVRTMGWPMTEGDISQAASYAASNKFPSIIDSSSDDPLSDDPLLTKFLEKKYGVRLSQ